MKKLLLATNAKKSFYYFSQKEVPIVILGNKGDMVHLRQVSSEEGTVFFSKSIYLEIKIIIIWVKILIKMIIMMETIMQLK